MKSKYKIGSLLPKNRVFLAPMLEYNDIAFRVLCKKAGAGLVYTGMTNPLTREKLLLQDKPAIQLFCASVSGIREFIKKHENKACLFDFNLGCPSEIARKHKVGAFMSDLSLIERILKEIKKTTKKPVTIKLRKSEKAFEILKIAEKYCDAICIHARTMKQGYSGMPDVEFALEIKKRTRLPVIYSGNVSESNVSDLLEKFDFVMIGREALGDPSIFARILGKKKKFGFFDYLRLARKYKLAFNQIKIQAMVFTRKKFSAGKMREKISKAGTIKELQEIFSKEQTM